VAEDNPTNQRVAMVMIGKLGCDVDLAADGRAAVEMARGGDYDLIFMDGQMPEIDGYDATREIRGWGGRFETLPIIALTASVGEDERQRSLDAGMSDHLTKPVTREAFRRTLERWLPPRADG
jgi:CheY-like chemotaxis protein